MKTIEEIRSTMKLHHTALARGYVSRKSNGIVEQYKGKFGSGYVIKVPCYYSTQYYHREYYIADNA